MFLHVTLLFVKYATTVVLRIFFLHFFQQRNSRDIVVANQDFFEISYIYSSAVNSKITFIGLVSM